ncbi:MAG: hypothetical protein H9893_10165 [Candidatus Niameybacter stercoravium]|nr:hypothetical protein [Candidatus Niameybacter stercoravium]
MISICPKCHNHDWDKEVKKEDKTVICCPKCRHEWSSKGLPLFILSGCSGVGKTTTAMELLQRKTNFIVLDADYFQFMPSDTLEDWAAHIERQEEISADIMQCGLPVLWAMAGCLDRLHSTYHERFFSGIHCLALTCETEELHRRMTEGRNITSEQWIQSSIEYNQYFREHDTIGDIKFSCFDTTNKSTKEIADYVIQWVNSYMEES